MEVYMVYEFKLFNPISRHSENEIIHTSLLRNLNLLALGLTLLM